jgi:hypothetical protein
MRGDPLIEELSEEVNAGKTIHGLGLPVEGPRIV